MRLLVGVFAIHLLSAAEHSGIVRCAGEPVAGVVVTGLSGGQRVSTVTDESGHYVLPGLMPGTWRIDLRLFGFRPIEREMTVVEVNVAEEWRLEVMPPAASALAPPVAKPPDRVSVLKQAPADAAEAAESFLVSGSLSRGLELQPREDELDKMRGDWAKDAEMGPPLPGAPKPEKQLAGVQGRFEAPGDFAGFGGPASGGPGLGVPKPKPEPKGKKGEKGVSIFGNRVNRRRDAVHGSAFASLRNSALDARPFSLNGQAVRKPSYAQTRLGVAAGGPLSIPRIIDSERTFVFVSYSATRSRNPYQATATLPTRGEWQGDFSQSRAPGLVSIYDPRSGAPFPGGRVPASRIRAAAAGLADFIPLPNHDGAVQNYQILASVPQDSDDLSARLNQSVSRRDHADVSFAFQRRSSLAQQLFGFRDAASGLGSSAAASWLHSIGGKSVNNARLAFSRNRSDLMPAFAYGRNVGAELGIQGVSPEPVNYGPPNLKFTNFGPLTDGSAMFRRDQTLTVSDALKFHREEHKIDAGLEFRRIQQNALSDQNARGTFVFSGLSTSGFDASGQPLAGTGFDFADFLLGLPQSSSIRYGSSDTYFRESVWAGYVQDDWRALDRLTIKYGLRYEYFPPMTEKYGRLANLDIAPGFSAVAVATPGAPGPFTGAWPEGLVNPDRNNFSPRLGIAWRPFEERRMTIRAGYGVFFDGSVYQRFAAQLSAQPPFARSSAVNTSASRVLTLEDGLTAAPEQTITNTFAVDRAYRAGYAQTWNLSIKHDFDRHLGIEAGYLGTKGTHLDTQRLPNRAAPGSPLTAEQRRQIGNAVGFTFESSEGVSAFQAAQFKLLRHLAKGVQAEALYTLAKSIDNASTFGGGGVTVAQDDKDLRAERGLSAFDQRHRVGMSWLWTSPWGDSGSLLRGSNWASRLLGNWSAGGAWFVSSGTPFTARVLGNRADASGTGAIGAGRADATGLAVTAGAAYFNPEAFRIPPPGRFGNAGRNTIPGPGSIAANISVARTFRLGDDRRRLEFRAESANFINHVSISGIGTVVNSTEYGYATAAQAMRSVVVNLRLRF